MPPRTPVTRDRALAEAVALADADGIDAVSMRNLSARLDVVPMALWKHFPVEDQDPAKLAALEGADGALVFSSGMAAIHAALASPEGQATAADLARTDAQRRADAAAQIFDDAAGAPPGTTATAPTVQLGRIAALRLRSPKSSTISRPCA